MLSVMEAQQLLFCTVASGFPLAFEKLENGKSLGFKKMFENVEEFLDRIDVNTKNLPTKPCMSCCHTAT